MSVTTIASALASPTGGDPDEIQVLDSQEERIRLASLTNAPPTTSSGPFAAQPAIRGTLTPAAAPPLHQPALVPDDDPWEEFNRSIFHFNDTVDVYVLEPAARAYRHVVPDHVRTSVRHFLANLESPVILANDVLQGQWERAHVTLSRFVINSTVGIGGLHDPATDMGYPYHREDFGQTLAVMGVPSGPYLVAPVFGPTTPRHIAGRVVDSFVHPLTWILAGEPTEILLAERAAEGVVAREEVLDTLEQVKLTSPDYYVAVRSFYRQNRNSEILNGQFAAGQDAGPSINVEEDLDIDF